MDGKNLCDVKGVVHSNESRGDYGSVVSLSFMKPHTVLVFQSATLLLWFTLTTSMTLFMASAGSCV